MLRKFEILSNYTVSFKYTKLIDNVFLNKLSICNMTRHRVVKSPLV